VPALIRALRDQDWSERDYRVQVNAARALNQIGLAARAAIPELVAALASPASEVQAAAAEALAGMGSEAAAAVPTLAAALSTSEFTVQRAAAAALGRIGPNAFQAVPALARLVRDCRDLEACRYAAETLALIGAAGLSVLLDTVGAHQDSNARAFAASALGKMGPWAEKAVPALLAALADADRSVRWAAVEALGALGPAAGAAAPVLADLARDEGNELHESAAEALGKIKAAPRPPV
jgi:HEAT repeat protein